MVAAAAAAGLAAATAVAASAAGETGPEAAAKGQLVRQQQQQSQQYLHTLFQTPHLQSAPVGPELLEQLFKGLRGRGLQAPVRGVWAPCPAPGDQGWVVGGYAPWRECNASMTLQTCTKNQHIVADLAMALLVTKATRRS